MNPKISIITVSFNAQAFIERTIRSVIEQNYSNIEYLVIDGNSKDGTVDIIKSYQDRIDFWLSEPDKSHFDAMNKGIKRASGDYILILNAGDRLESPETLTNAMKGTNNEDFIYSRAEYINEKGERWPWHKKTPTPDKLSNRSFINGMVICHHCMIVKRSITPLFMLEPWKVSNDIDWAIRVMENVKNVHFWDNVFCLYLEGGISKVQKWKAVRERFDISLTHFGGFYTILEQFRILGQLVYKKLR